MLFQKSIRNKIFFQLVSTTAILVVIFSVISYQILKINIIQNYTDYLSYQAEEIINNKSYLIPKKDYEYVFYHTDSQKKDYKLIKKKDKYCLILFYPTLKQDEFLMLKKNITQSKKILDNIFISLFIIIITAIILVFFYSLFVSKILTLNLKELSAKINQFDSNFTNYLKVSDFPLEFKELIKNINHLIKRILNYNSTQKELFIGIAHELKTPLAVIKAKNDVTLIKERDKNYYIETIKNSSNSIDNINKIIEAILKVGRQEGAQFDEATQFDIIEYIKKEARNFSLLGIKSGQKLILDLKPEVLHIKLQQALFLQILQNFIQNAFKFSPANSKILISSYEKNGYFYLFVDDEGDAIDENRDYFAPFKRFGKEEGVGLGLYLAKNAATALKAQIKLSNLSPRGVRASFKIKIKR